jgi:hypothetical protein
MNNKLFDNQKIIIPLFVPVLNDTNAAPSARGGTHLLWEPKIREGFDNEGVGGRNGDK